MVMTNVLLFHQDLDSSGRGDWAFWRRGCASCMAYARAYARLEKSHGANGILQRVCINSCSEYWERELIDTLHEVYQHFDNKRDLE